MISPFQFKGLDSNRQYVQVSLIRDTREAQPRLLVAGNSKLTHVKRRVRRCLGIKALQWTGSRPIDTELLECVLKPSIGRIAFLLSARPNLKKLAGCGRFPRASFEPQHFGVLIKAGYST